MVCHFSSVIWLDVINRNRLPSMRAAFVRTLSLSLYVGSVASNRRNNKLSEIRSILGSELLNEKKQSLNSAPKNNLIPMALVGVNEFEF